MRHGIFLGLILACFAGCSTTDDVTIKATDVQYGDTPGKTIKDEIDEVKASAASKTHTHTSSEVTGFDSAAIKAMGTKASTNTMNHNRYSEADLTASTTIKKLQVEIKAIQAKLASIPGAGGNCPAGYTQDTTVTKYVVCKNGKDEMVKAGDFWIDRYEMTIVDSKTYSSGKCNGSGTTFGTAKDDYPSTFPDSGNWTAPLFACSVKAVLPSRYMNWFQNQQACLVVGKRLCTNAEWQGAAAGTLENYCHVGATVVTKPTGSYPSCVSNWGAFDMAGNLAERVAGWVIAGREWSTGTKAASATPWPSGFGDGQDETLGLEGWSLTDVGKSPVNGMPACVVRGGSANASSAKAGIYNIGLSISPALAGTMVGARCCRR